MKNHFQSLFSSRNWKKTIFIATMAVLMIVASQLVGTTDNLPGIALLLGGMVSIFFAMVHPWKKSTNYGILAAVCLGLILLTFLIIYILSLLKKTEYLSEAVVMIFTGLICLPGIITGIIGSIFWGSRSK
jgi:succinate-acetate transporter protein